jgi:hypothetical protein
MKICKASLYLCISAILYCSPPTKPEVHTPPDITGVFTSPANGCGNSNFIAYKSNSLKSKWIIVKANRDSLAMTTEFKTFIINTSLSQLTVHYDYYSINKDSTRQHNFAYCDDAMEVKAQIPESWNAIDGSVDMKRSEIDSSGIFYDFSVTVHLRDVRLVNPAKTDTVFLKELNLDTVRVGWMPG